MICDFREHRDPRPAVYTVWLVGPCGDGGGCAGHPTCLDCGADVRAGRSSATLDRITSLRVSA